MNVNPNIQPVRLDCQVVSISKGKVWKGAIVSDVKTNKQVYFGHIAQDVSIEEGDNVYITAQPLIAEERMEKSVEEKKMHVVLYTSDGTKIDWTLI